MTRPRPTAERLATLIPATLAMVLTATLAWAGPRPHDNWNTDGENGHLYVHGALTEGACHLDMTSEWQQVELGATPKGQLRHPGDQGTPVQFRLQFRDCVRTAGTQTDRKTGTVTWDALQPVITVSFVAPADPDMPSLIRTAGEGGEPGILRPTGVALRLQDGQGRTVIPGERGEPQFLTPANDALVYTVTPVRTPAPLVTGSYRAVTDFQVSYD